MIDRPRIDPALPARPQSSAPQRPGGPRLPSPPVPVPAAVQTPQRPRLDSASPRPQAQTVPAAQRLAQQTPIVPPQSVSGRALVLVIAIMCFLACLAAGFLILVSDAAQNWQRDIGREVTIQVKPVDGLAMDPRLQKAIALAKATRGVADARLVSEDQSRALLEPWLGADFDLAQLPVPRLITLTLPDPTDADLTGLKTRLQAEVKSASLDDHSVWASRLRVMANTFVIGGGVILFLVLASMVLSVVFATRAATAGNRHVIEVLHFVGSQDSYIAGEFQRHFLVLGLKGGIIGGLAAMAAFLLAGIVTRDSTGASTATLFGGVSVGWTGYVAALGIALVVALLTALTSRLTVRAQLDRLE